MARPPAGVLDDSYRTLIINDISGGMNVYKGALSLSSNESPDMLNVLPVPGGLEYRGGWAPYATLVANADACYSFYDASGTKHMVVWRDGDVVDVVSGAEVSVEAGAYTAGERVGVCDLAGILYWATPTVALRYWDGAVAAAVAQTGVSPPPASGFLMVYTGAIVAFGVDFTGSNWQPHVFSWSVVNQPGNWDAVNSQAVGPNNGYGIEFGMAMGVGEIGVPPTRTLVVGRYDQGIFSYTGALGSLQEALINCPTGCVDGASAQYIPGENLGAIVFLGRDGQVWATDGIRATAISLPLSPLLGTAVMDGLSMMPPARFWSGYNPRKQYYWLDVSGTQYVYKWDMKCWTLFRGWPSGPSMKSTDVAGIEAYFVAAADGNLALAQVALAQVGDNGVAPSIYYTTPDIHGGDPEKLKEFHWIAPFCSATGTTYRVTGASMPTATGMQLTSRDLIFEQSIGAPAGTFTLDSSLLDGPDLLAGGGATPIIGPPRLTHGRLSCLVTPTGILAGMGPQTENLRGGAARFTVAYYSDTVDFQLTALELRYIERGYNRVGGQTYSVQSGILPVPPPFDVYVPVSLE